MKKSVRQLSLIEKFLAYAILIFFSLFAIYPILVVFSISLRPGDRLLSKSLAIIPPILPLRVTSIFLCSNLFCAGWLIVWLFPFR